MSHFPFASGAYGRASERFERTVGMIAGCASLVRGLGVWCLDILFVLTRLDPPDPAPRAARSDETGVRIVPCPEPVVVEMHRYVPFRDVGGIRYREEIVATFRFDGAFVTLSGPAAQEIDKSIGVDRRRDPGRYMAVLMDQYLHWDTAAAHGALFAVPRFPKVRSPSVSHE